MKEVTENVKLILYEVKLNLKYIFCNPVIRFQREKQKILTQFLVDRKSQIKLKLIKEKGKIGKFFKNF